MFKSVILSARDLARLDDGQEWWVAGDEVILGGYLPDEDNESPEFQLSVNGETHDNWIRWSQMPSWLKQKFRAGRPALNVKPHTVTISDEHYAHLKKRGDGHASAGIRKIIAESDSEAKR